MKTDDGSGGSCITATCEREGRRIGRGRDGMRKSAIVTAGATAYQLGIFAKVNLERRLKAEHKCRHRLENLKKRKQR